MADKLNFTHANRKIGPSGLEAFPVSFGCWRFGELNPAQVKELLVTGLEVGIDFYDTADIYGYSTPIGFGGAEAMLGEVLGSEPSLRDQMILATKGGIEVDKGAPYLSTKAYLIEACERSLTRLKTDIIDIYYIHRPDNLTHPAEVAEALNSLVEDGKVKHLAVSNYNAAQVAALSAYLDSPLIANQVEMSPWYTDLLFDGTMDQIMEKGMAPIAWSPLAGGRLVTGNADGLTQAERERLTAVVDRIDQLAAREGVDRAAICLAYLLAHPAGIIPIIGTTNPARVHAAKDAFDVRLDRKDWYDLTALSRGYPFP